MVNMEMELDNWKTGQWNFQVGKELLQFPRSLRRETSRCNPHTLYSYGMKNFEDLKFGPENFQ